MSMLWIICGAGRGVGKTTLAQDLCKILPNSVYAKYGHSDPKPEKPDNFFNSLEDIQTFIKQSQNSAEHIIAESNTIVHLGIADVTIYIDGVYAKTDFREDSQKLKELSDLEITSESKPVLWKRRLRTKLQSRQLVDRVCDCLTAQRRYLFGFEPKICSKIWFESAGSRVFGRGLAQLLENIDRYGTLQNAAKVSNMSYRYAWNLIHVAEENLDKVLVQRQAGGRQGGGSVLSSQGRLMVDVFKKLNKEVASFADKRFIDLYKEDANV